MKTANNNKIDRYVTLMEKQFVIMMKPLLLTCTMVHSMTDKSYKVVLTIYIEIAPALTENFSDSFQTKIIMDESAQC